LTEPARPQKRISRDEGEGSFSKDFPGKLTSRVEHTQGAGHNRDTGRLSVNDRDLMIGLRKSRRSIISYLAELDRHGVCEIESARNQHHRGQIEIRDAFWPYHKMPAPVAADNLTGYIKQIQKLLIARPSVKISFTAADTKLAANLWVKQVPLEQIGRAVLLACSRKQVAWCNGRLSGPITSLHYFLTPIEEVAHVQVGPEYWRYLEFRLKPLEARWLQRQTRAACADFAQAEEHL